MSQIARVRKELEVAAQAKGPGREPRRSQGEAKATVGTWRTVCDDPETTNDLRSIAVYYRDALTAATVNGNAAAQDAALAALSSIAARYQ